MVRIGIVGSGQLGRMIALAAAPLGHEVKILGTHDGDPGLAVARGVLAKGYDDEEALDRLCASVDVVTYEFENVPSAPLAAAVARTTSDASRSTSVKLLPSLEALRTASDRLLEKSTFEALGIVTAAFADVPSQEALDAAAQKLGLPLVLKTRRMGYDGKGQKVLRTAADVSGAFAALGGVPCIVESFVDFRREVSLVAARSGSGEVAFYPLAENEHRGGILYKSTALSLFGNDGELGALQSTAESYVRALFSHLDYVGVMALELFERRDGVLVANEIAPRVHNTGHWTMDGAITSQFEQHVRAITGAPLGRTERRCHAAMVNLVGVLPDTSAVIALPDVHVHLYGKAPRPGRKVGHVNVLGSNEEELSSRLAAVEALIRWA